MADEKETTKQLYVFHWRYSMLRRLARWYLGWSWMRRLPRGERLRLEHFGATGNPDHEPFQWVIDP